MAFAHDELDSFAEQWAVIKRFCSSSHRQWVSGGGTLIMETPPDQFYNLPVVLAFSLLDEVLTSLSVQGLFAIQPRDMLGAKMTKSKNKLPWVDYAAVKVAKEQRNDLAHHGKLIPEYDCRQIVELIGNQLKAFGAIS